MWRTIKPHHVQGIRPTSVNYDGCGAPSVIVSRERLLVCAELQAAGEAGVVGWPEAHDAVVGFGAGDLGAACLERTSHEDEVDALVERRCRVQKVVGLAAGEP